MYVAFACTYQPNEDFFKEIQKPQFLSTPVNFFATTDSLDLRNTVRINIAPQSTIDIIGFSLKLGQEVVKDGDYVPSIIELDSKKFKDGVYDLSLTLIKKAQSQSLASKLNAENYEVKFSKKAILFNAPLIAPKILRTGVENGILIIEWEPYKGRAFQSYYVRSLNHSSLSFNRNLSKEFITSFVGGSETIDLTLKAYDQEIKASVNVDYPLNQKIERTATGLRFSWDQSPFQNWLGVRIFITDAGITKDFVIAKTSTEYTYEKTLTFPYEIVTYLYAVNSIGGLTYLADKQFSTAFPFKVSYSGIKSYKFKLASPSDSTFTVIYPNYYDSDENVVTVHEKKNGNQLAYRSGFICASPNWQYLYSYENQKIALLNSSTLAIKEQFDPSSLIGNFDEFYQIHASDQNIVLLYVRKGIEKKYFAIDWLTKSLLYSGVTSNPRVITKWGQLTPDGTSFYATDYEEKINLRLSLNNTPNQYFYLENRNLYHYFPNKDLKVTAFSGQLYVNTILNSPNLTLNKIAYNNTANLVKIFSNQTGQFGIAYLEDNVIKIDFFQLDTLAYIQTVTTWLPKIASGNNYEFYLVGNTFILNTVNLGYHTLNLNF
ncbi:MAG: hypothetical protein ACKVOQ_05735 [Cyclobacteriaceae bacterium]